MKNCILNNFNEEFAEQAKSIYTVSNVLCNYSLVIKH